MTIETLYEFYRQYCFYIYAYLVVVNGVAFALFGVDKLKAAIRRWRIPEATLMTFAFIGGSVGAFAGMKVFHHKTRKPKFAIGVPLFFIMHVLIAGYIAYRFINLH